MDSLISEVLGQVRGIAQDVLRREGVRLRTATVTGEDPARIRYDGEAESSIVTPRRTVRVAIGDRVVVTKSRGQATIIGILTRQVLGWEKFPLASGLTYAGHGWYAGVQRDGERRFLHGRIGRTSGNFEPGTDYLLGTLDEQDWPTQVAGGIAQVSSFVNPGFGRVEIKQDGGIYVGVSKATSWVGLDSITWDVR